MNQTFFKIFKVVFIIVLIVGGIWFLDLFFKAWDSNKEQERAERIRSFCSSFLEKDSVLYGRCFDNASNDENF